MPKDQYSFDFLCHAPFKTFYRNHYKIQSVLPTTHFSKQLSTGSINYKTWQPFWKHLQLNKRPSYMDKNRSITTAPMILGMTFSVIKNQLLWLLSSITISDYKNHVILKGCAKRSRPSFPEISAFILPKRTLSTLLIPWRKCIFFSSNIYLKQMTSAHIFHGKAFSWMQRTSESQGILFTKGSHFSFFQ